MQSDISLSRIINNWYESKHYAKIEGLCQDIAFWKGKCFNESDIDLILKRKELDLSNTGCTLEGILLYNARVRTYNLW